MRRAKMIELVATCHSAAANNGWWDATYQKLQKDNVYTEGIIPITVMQKLALVTSELAEALEALRGGNRVNKEEFEIAYEKYSILTGPDMVSYHAVDEFKDYFKEAIKDTVEDEIVDTYVRIYDLVGFLMSMMVDSDNLENIANTNSKEDIAKACETNFYQVTPNEDLYVPIDRQVLLHYVGVTHTNEELLSNILYLVTVSRIAKLSALYRMFPDSQGLRMYVDAIMHSCIFPTLAALDLYVELLDMKVDRHMEMKLYYNNTRGKMHGGKNF